MPPCIILISCLFINQHELPLTNRCAWVISIAVIESVEIGRYYAKLKKIYRLGFEATAAQRSLLLPIATSAVVRRRGPISHLQLRNSLDLDSQVQSKQIYLLNHHRCAWVLVIYDYFDDRYNKVFGCRIVLIGNSRPVCGYYLQVQW